ncbi:hypothetical protein RSOLAG22IIIB_12312 [Rhizoctonia solani]|uniref:Uncharacterized protein n=1 Tax=Rhizoctonia solani TaxID=456999 RepID=A0A0K6GD01_9AGAM|nr:hypothetical protein RSOLAG22IIIB_12312 [Rhizoctonia solani]
MENSDIVRSFKTRFIRHRTHQHPARVSYWRQLKDSTPSDECIGLVTTHLWLSALLNSPKPNTLYFDPPLFEQLLDQYQQNPMEMTADQVPLLFNRHEFWPHMESTAHILALARASQVCSPGGPSWILLDLTVRDGSLKSVEVTIPPSCTFDNDAFGDLISFFIGALNQIFPGPKLAGASSRVQQRTMTLVLPEPFTEEATLLVLMAYTLGKFLDQAIPGVDVKAMRQSLCYYYNQALRCSDVDFIFPWAGLTDTEGTLMTENNSDKVGRRRFMLTSNREPSPMEMFPRQRSYSTTLATAGPSEPFFLELAQLHSTHPEGILLETTGRSVTDLKKAILLGEFPSLDKNFPGSRLQVPEALSLQEYIDLVHDSGGPESAASLKFFLLAKHEEKRIKLDWLKDAIYLQPEQLHAGFDLDSLTLSSFEAPQLLKPGVYYAIPDPRFSLTTRNELDINLDGEKIGMHTCPNFCIMTFSGNNQFRLLVFFPRNRQREGNLWRNTAELSEMKDWYETFLTALRIYSNQAPSAWQHAVEKTLEALPNTFEMASEQRNKGGHSSGHCIEPIIMNAVFKIMRRIIDTTPGLAKYRGYFFHLCGMNLKLGTMNIHGRMDNNPMEYAFSLFNFVDWYSANPHDIVADIGWTANPNRSMMPDDLQNSTLLFRVGPLTELLRAAYTKPQIDQYCSSYVVGGLRSTPSAKVRKGCGVVKAQAYPKDMILTYRHQNQVSAWGANRVMKTEPRDILDRLLAAKAIVCYPTGTISAFKSTLAKGWSTIINRQSQLPIPARKSPEVVLLTSVLAYWLKSLIKRPDEMGYSTEMAKRLQLIQNAERFGIPCLRSASLDDDGLRMNYRVEAERFRILSLSGLTVEAPVLPNNIPFQAIEQPDPLQSPPPSPPQTPPVNQLWPQSSQDFLETLINVHLPRTLWSHFTRDRLQNSPTALRLRKKPLQKRQWPEIVEPLNTLRELENKFSDSFDRLFPANWSITQPKGDLVAYERDFLHRIREHVNTKPAKARSTYSSELRRRIRTMLMNTWDYLPNVHSHRIWAYDPGPAGQRIFRICPKSR